MGKFMQLNVGIRQDQQEILKFLKESGVVRNISEFARDAIDREISIKIDIVIASCVASIRDPAERKFILNKLNKIDDSILPVVKELKKMLIDDRIPGKVE